MAHSQKLPDYYVYNINKLRVQCQKDRHISYIKHQSVFDTNHLTYKYNA